MTIENVGTVFPRYRIVHDNKVWAGNQWLPIHKTGVLFASHDLATLELEQLKDHVEEIDRIVVVPLFIGIAANELDLDFVRKSLAERIILSCDKLIGDLPITSVTIDWSKLEEMK